MLVLRFAPEGRDATVVVPVFGVGLIGASIVERLSGSGALQESLPLSWDEPDTQARQMKEIEGYIDRLLEPVSNDTSLSGETPQLHFLWCAGRAGFSAEEAAVANELESFRRVLDLADRCAAKLDRGLTSFSMVSSAGGLFEKQRVVTPRSRPVPGRPYGRSKLAQEELLSQCRGHMNCRVYRLSSVYGYARPGRRMGLIAALAENALKGRVTRVVGRLDTLRDFVWVGDVADRLAGRVATGCQAQGSWIVETLAGGKATSILEVMRLVERALGRRTYVAFSSGRSNQEDITFSRAVLPSDWVPSDLQTNVRQVCFDTTGLRGPFNLAPSSA